MTRDKYLFDLRFEPVTVFKEQGETCHNIILVWHIFDFFIILNIK